MHFKISTDRGHGAIERAKVRYLPAADGCGCQLVLAGSAFNPGNRLAVKLVEAAKKVVFPVDVNSDDAATKLQGELATLMASRNLTADITVMVEPC